MATINEFASPIWAPSGLTIGALVLYGTWLSPAIFVGALLTNLTTAGDLIGILGIATGNMLEALAGATMLLWILEKRIFKHYSELIGMMIIIVLACSISATFGVSTLLIQGLIKPYDYAYSWYTWWSGDAVGAFIVLPLILEIYFYRNEKLPLGLTPKRIVSAVLFALVCMMITTLVFVYDHNQAYVWILCPFLILSGFFLGKFLSRVVLIVLASFIVFLSTAGKTPFELGDINLNLIYLQCLLFSFATSILFVRPLDTRFKTGRTYIMTNLIGWISIFAVIFMISAAEKQTIKDRLHSVIESAEASLQRASSQYELLLSGGEALLQIKPEVTGEEWRAYVNSLELEKNYSAINGFGFIRYFDKVREKEYLTDVNNLGIKNFHIKELDPNYSGNFDNRFVITMVEPIEKNHPALGLDIGSEKKRREAAEKSRALKQTMATEPIILIQDDLKRYGFLLLHPVWDQTQNFVGWTYAPVLVPTFYSKALTPFRNSLHIKIFHDEQLIFQENGKENFPLRDKFFRKRNVQIFNQNHSLEFYPTSNFLLYHSSMSVPLALLLILFMLFISGFLMEQFTFGQRAEELVIRRTQELEKSKMQLIQSSKMASLGEMASSMAHEINNPLTIIIGKIKIIKIMLEDLKIDNAPLNQEIGRIEQTTTRISKIIRGLRTFSRAAQNDPFEVAPFAEIVRDTLDLCSERIKAEGITLTVDEIPEVSLFCRPSQISQVLLNLLNNASDAVGAQKNKLISIKFTLTNTHRLIVSVTDSGPGITKEIAKRIMEPFFTTKTVGKGTGLGLSISKSIIEEHGGSLRLDELSPNTRFLIELPISNPKSGQV